MASTKATRPATAETVNEPRNDLPGGAIPFANSTWRKRFKVHPAADIFPMMSDAELDELGKDIKRHGLKHPIILLATADADAYEQVLLDGRNRLEAMERAGLFGGNIVKQYRQGDPVAHIIGPNIRRRHLTKQQQADLIVAAHMAAAKARAEQKADRYIARSEARVAKAEKLRQVGEVSRGGRGKVDEAKAGAVADAKREGVSKRSIERSFAKAKGRTPKYTPRPIPKPRSGKPVVGLDAARRHYLDRCADPDVDLGEEQRAVIEAFKEIAGKRLASRVKGGRP